MGYDSNEITAEMREAALAHERERQAAWRELDTGLKFRPSLCEGVYGYRYSSWRCKFHGQFQHLHIEFIDSEGGEATERSTLRSQQGVRRVAEAIERVGYDMKGLTEAVMAHPAVLALPDKGTPEELEELDKIIKAGKLTTSWGYV